MWSPRRSLGPGGLLELRLRAGKAGRIWCAMVTIYTAIDMQYLPNDTTYMLSPKFICKPSLIACLTPSVCWKTAPFGVVSVSGTKSNGAHYCSNSTHYRSSPLGWKRWPYSQVNINLSIQVNIGHAVGLYNSETMVRYNCLLEQICICPYIHAP